MKYLKKLLKLFRRPTDLEKFKETLDKATGFSTRVNQYNLSDVYDAEFLYFVRGIWSDKEILEVTRKHFVDIPKTQADSRVDFSIDEILEAFNKRCGRTAIFEVGRVVRETGRYGCKNCGAEHFAMMLELDKLGLADKVGAVRDFKSGEEFAECPRCGNHAAWQLMSKPVLPRAVRHWTLTTLREKLIGAKVVRHSRKIVF
jgi:hypothetical protein